MWIESVSRLIECTHAPQPIFLLQHQHAISRAAIAYCYCKVSASQSEDWVFDPRPLSESPYRSLGKSVHLDRPGKKQKFRLRPAAHCGHQNKKKQNKKYNICLA